MKESSNKFLKFYITFKSSNFNQQILIPYFRVLLDIYTGVRKRENVNFRQKHTSDSWLKFELSRRGEAIFRIFELF